MDIENNRRRGIARAATAVFLTAALAACADQSTPAPVYMKNAGSAPPVGPYVAPRPLPPRTVIVVRHGQTLNGIAHEYHLRPAQIVTANGLAPPYELKAGARLVIPAPGAPAAAPAIAAMPRPAIPPAPPQVAAAPPSMPPPQVAAAPPPSMPTPQPPARPETLMPPHPATAAAPAPTPTPATATATADPNVIPLDGPPPKQIAVAAGAPPVMPPRNPAAALPLPGESSVDWGTADSAQGAAGGRFPWPVRGRVLASYGGTAGGGHNDGINIAAPKGTPVRAVDGGTVAYVGNEVKGYGNLVLIKHANGWISAYAHLDSLNVKLGDKITSGEVIARVGATGGVSEPQLHFELRRGKKPVDPREFLAPAPSAAAPGADRPG